MRLTLLVNPDTPQVETVKVDETLFALRLLDAFHLAFTSGKHLFMLERASVTTAQAHTRISPLGRRISMEWCMWWLQQHGGQQQYGQLFDVLCLVRVAVAVLANAIGCGSDVAGWSFCDLVHVGRLCLRRVIFVSFNGPFVSLHAWIRTLGGCVLACAPRCARTYAYELAALPLRRARYISRSR